MVSVIDDLRRELEHAEELAGYLGRHVRDAEWTKAERDVGQLQDQAIVILSAVRACALEFREKRPELVRAARR